MNELFRESINYCRYAISKKSALFDIDLAKELNLMAEETAV